MKHTITRIEFDPMTIKGGEYEVKARATLTNGEVRDMAVGGERKCPDDELAAQRIMLRQTVDLIMGGRDVEPAPSSQAKRLEELQAAVRANQPVDMTAASFNILLEGIIELAHYIGPNCKDRVCNAMKAAAKEYE